MRETLDSIMQHEAAALKPLYTVYFILCALYTPWEDKHLPQRCL